VSNSSSQAAGTGFWGPLPAWLKAVILAIGLLLMLIVGIALLPQSVWRGLITRLISHETHRSVHLEKAKVHLLTLNPQLTLEGFSLANADWASGKDMLTIKRFEATVSLLSLLRFHWVFPQITLDTPVMDLQRDASGRANWDFSNVAAEHAPQQPSAPLHVPVIRKLSLTDGKLTLEDRVRKLKFAGQISVQETLHEVDEHALLLRGSGELNGKPFELRLNGAPLIDVRPSTPYGFDLSVSAADIKLNAHTTFSHPFDMAQLTSSFHITGGDLSDVYYLTGLALPNTPPYDVSGTLQRDSMQFRIEDLRGKLGGSDIEGKLSINAENPRPKLTATLNSKQLNFEDLAAPLGTQAAPTTKTLKSTTQAAAPAALLLPDADLQTQRVRGMDADVLFDAQSVMSGALPMQKIHFHLLLNDGKITIDPLSFILAQGQFSGTVAIDARNAIPQTRVDMKLTQVDLAQFKAKSSTSAPLEGQLLGRIRLQGSGTSVHKTAADANGDITLVVPSGQMRDTFAELTGVDLSTGLGLLLTKNSKDTEVRCGVANFHASDGDLVANTLIIDTSHVLVSGHGDINLKNEALDLLLRGQPKEPRLVRLRAPIILHGTLRHPEIGLQTGKLLAQAGAATALAALLTPVAALLAFVDPGLAKDANCAALIGQAEEGKNIPKE
jgi:AsmA family protein